MVTNASIFAVDEEVEYHGQIPSGMGKQENVSFKLFLRDVHYARWHSHYI